MQRKVMYYVQHNMQRKSVNFDSSTSAELLAFFNEGSGEWHALADLAGEKPGSESDVLRALVRLGMRLVRDQQLEAGYTHLAASLDAEDRQWSEASTKHAADRWRNE